MSLNDKEFEDAFKTLEASDTPTRPKLPLAEIAFLVLIGVVSALLLARAMPQVLDSTVKLILKAPLSEESRRYVMVSQVGASVLGFLLGLWVGNVIWKGISGGRARWEQAPVGSKVTIVVAIFLGFMASVPFLFFLNALLNGNPLALIGAMLALLAGFTTLSVFVLKSIADVLPWNQGQVKSKKSGIKILDTNVIIDGRLLEVLKTGFLEGPFYVPGFVIDELQHIADSADALRRQRGRRGLEILKEMQNAFTLQVRTLDKLAGHTKDEVDQRLVRLARAIGADIVTNDWNLNRVASLQDVRILNINHLSLALRPSVLPSERMVLSIVKEGNQPGQGVGYLEDGTMVVVDGGKRYMNTEIEVLVSQVIQTERGKMIFATPADDEDYSPVK